MLTFPNAKINLGLNITEKRPDGYHNLETIFYPVPIEDALEINILNEGNGKFRLHQAGLEIEGEAESNLVVKAYKLLDDRFNLPPVDIHLFKHIPSGAGLGGGSADAAFMLKLLNNKFELGLPVEKPNKNLFELDYVGIKASQFSFNRLQKADPVLGVDMASTGEVGCIGEDTSCAVLKSMLSVGYRIPEKNILMSTGTPKQKVEMLKAAQMLKAKGYNIYATGGSSKFLTENGIENTRVYWPSEEGHPQALEMLHKKEIDMVVNIPRDLSEGELDNGYKIRRAAVDLNIPLVTNARLASAFIQAFCTMTIDDIAIKSWDEYK